MTLPEIVELVMNFLATVDMNSSAPLFPDLSPERCGAFDTTPISECLGGGSPDAIR
ncbi:hypothetical protein [Hoyosella altamirensis]|uniref:hypothetical protein n=1 Tax=Hoyosella altamirensis TaxID=616997 RepID=UPI0012ECC6E7|nr:hypothetical protein [Hoyosella altamirensis]